MRYLCATCLLFLVVEASAQKRFVYVNNQTQPNTINAFEINTDGSLTPLVNSPFATGGVGAEGPIESMAIVHTASGSILYAANGGDPSVSAFTINPGIWQPAQIADSCSSPTKTEPQFMCMRLLRTARSRRSRVRHFPPAPIFQDCL